VVLIVARLAWPSDQLWLFFIISAVVLAGLVVVEVAASGSSLRKELEALRQPRMQALLLTIAGLTLGTWVRGNAPVTLGSFVIICVGLGWLWRLRRAERRAATAEIEARFASRELRRRETRPPHSGR
jgi:predicted small integral membrane protein